MPELMTADPILREDLSRLRAQNERLEAKVATLTARVDNLTARIEKLLPEGALVWTETAELDRPLHFR